MAEWSVRRAGKILAKLLQLVALCSFVLALAAGSAGAQQEDKSGVSPSRLKLPKGPGSLEGIGENAEPNLSMGLMTYGVPIQLPPGYSGATPSLRLAYGSGSGNSEVGLGWSLTLPSIERLTSRGLPKYDASDVFAAGGGEELVRISDSGVYRARFEGTFIRYTWVDAEKLGKAGYFRAEYPDGRIGYFGARADGTLVSNARVEGPNGVFRYHLVEAVDPLGHAVRYEYEKSGSYALLSRVLYGFQASGNKDPRYVVKLSYDARPDEISDARPGFDLRLSQRLTGLLVVVQGVQLRRYVFSYLEPSKSTFLSRLSHIEQFGANDAGPYPIDFRFEYTGTASLACSLNGCDAPLVADVAGSLGVDFASGKADLIDINGDGLPDVVDTSAVVDASSDKHRFFVTRIDSEGKLSFDEATPSRLAGPMLDQPSVQTVDLDGDGFTDLVDTSAGAGSARLYFNKGGGDWARSEDVDHLGLPDFSQAQNLRFFDYDNDKRPDLYYNDGSSAFVYANRGDLTFVERHDVEPLGQGFAALQLADMNGDGMQDAVQMAYGLVAYKLNLGFGHWSDWIEMANAPDAAAGLVRLADINGDGLADLVSIFADEVRFSLNANGRKFAAEVTTKVEEAEPGSSVRLADMNGSGSVDVVWITPSGKVSFLELFSVRPNLLSRVTTGAGKVIEVVYGSSVRHMAEAAKNDRPWSYRLPNPMLTVDTIAAYDTLSGVHQTRRFEYRDGYYDGVEKQFRGFESVTVVTDGEELKDADGVQVTTEQGETTYQFDVGREDVYHKALLKTQTVRSNARELRQEDHTYADDCRVVDPAQVALDRVSPPVRFICPKAKTTTITEAGSTTEPATLIEEYVHDAYGNQTRTYNRGVTAIGGKGCPCTRDAVVFGSPCGDGCLGDESVDETDFVSPADNGDRWIIDKPVATRHYGVDGGSLHTETNYFYDGPKFEGLPAGKLTAGQLMRTEARVDGSTLISTESVERDVHGNPLEVRDGNGHRRRFGYDPSGLFLTTEEVVFDAAKPPYSLLMTASYHPLYDAISEASAWMVKGEGAQSDARLTRYEYDSFARLIKMAQPGDSLELPTDSYAYEIGPVVSRIVTRSRSKSGAPLDVETVQCFDGLGRKYQTRSKIDANHYQVSGFDVYELQGNVRRQHQPFVAQTADCDAQEPLSRYTRSSYDATGRVLQIVAPDADIYGTPSMTTSVYEPLRNIVSDPDDAPGERFEGTPEVTLHDGLGRTTGIDRYLSKNDIVHVELTYDELGHLRGYAQDAGDVHVEKIQEYDLLGRVTRVNDPDSGKTLFDYDNVGNVVAETDARGMTTLSRFDEANRLVEQWHKAHRRSTHIDYDYDRLEGCAPCTNLPGELARVTFPMDPEDAKNRGEDLLGYDARGRSIYNQRTLDGHAFELRTELDNLGRVVARQYPTGTRIEHVVDGLGRITQVPGYLPRVTYEARGPLQSIEFANGVVTTQKYDSLARLANLETIGPSGEAIQAYAYARDRVGNIASIADGSDAGNEPSAKGRYVYDALYRLTGAHLDEGRAPEEHLEYGYDALDNITHKVSKAGAVSREHVGDYKYERIDGAGPHAVTRAGDAAVRYDAAGNVTSLRDDTYEWDFLGRMVGATRGFSNLARYAYGPDRGRVKKRQDTHVTYYVAPDFEVRDGVLNVYIVLGGNRVGRLQYAESASQILGLTGSEAVGHSITAADALAAGPPSDAPSLQQGQATNGGGICSASAACAVVALSGATTYWHWDHLGSLTAETGDGGNVDARMAAWPFGSQRAIGPVAQSYFGGRERDEESGLIYFGSRYLSPELGRFLSPDEAFGASVSSSPESRARYGYVRNNPVNAIDPSGHKSVVVLAGRPAAFAESGAGKYALYELKVYRNTSPQLYKALHFFHLDGVFLKADARFLLARDAWYPNKKDTNGKEIVHSDKRYGENNELPPGEHVLWSQGTDNFRLKIGDKKGDWTIKGPDGLRSGIAIHDWNPLGSEGCLTSGRNPKQQDSIIPEIQAAVPDLQKADETVPFFVEAREAVAQKVKGAAGQTWVGKK